MYKRGARRKYSATETLLGGLGALVIVAILIIRDIW